MEVPSTGPGGSFSMCLNLSLRVSFCLSVSFEDDNKNSKGRFGIRIRKAIDPVAAIT